MRSRLAALVLAVAMVVPTQVRAAGPAAEQPPPVEPELQEAYDLHIEADAKFNTADYDAAIEAWERAYAALPWTPASNSIRAVIQYNIAASYQRLYELRNDVEYLKKARANLERFQKSIDETYDGRPEEAEQARVDVKAKLDAINASIAKAERDPPPTEPKVEDPPKDPVKQPPKGDDAPPVDRTSGRGLRIGGGVLVGLGVAAGVGMGVAMAVGRRANGIDGLDDRDLAAREDKFARGRRANGGAIAAGVVGLALVATGVALLVVGARKRSSKTAAIGRGVAALFGGRLFF